VAKGKKTTDPGPPPVAVYSPDDEERAAKSAMPAQIPVRLASGEVGTIAPADLKETIASGGQVISPTALAHARQQAEQEKKYGGMTGAAVAYHEAQLRGITMGLSDPALIEGARLFGGNESAEGVRQHLAGYAGENKAADVLGQAGGALAGATAVPFSPAGATARLGSAVEGGAARALGGGMLARVGGRVAAGAAEGALYGVGSSISESALGDTPITAEKVLAGAGTGAFLGGATSGLFALAGAGMGAARDEAGRYLASMKPQQIEALVERDTGYAPKGLGDKIKAWYAKAASAVSGHDEGDISRLLNASTRDRQVAVYDSDKVLDAATRQIRQHGDDMMRGGRVVSDEFRGDLKADKIARSVKQGNELEVAKAVEDQLRNIINGAEAQLEKGPAPQMVKSIESSAKAAYRAQIELASGRTFDNATAYMALDNVKRDLQRMTNHAQNGWRNIADPIEMRAYRETADWLRDTSEALRVHLEDTDLWGKAAQKQAAINEAWTRQIDASDRFRAALTTKIGRDPANPYLKLEGMDPGKLDSYVRNLQNPNKDLTHIAVRDYAQSTEDLTKAISEAYELPPEVLNEVHKVGHAAAGFRSTVDQAGHDLALANAYKRLTQGQSGSTAGILGTLGLAVGGLPGGAVGAGAGMLANPGKVIAQFAAAERLQMKVNAALGSSTRGFLRGGSAGALAPVSEVASEKGFARATSEVTSWATDANKTQASIAKSLGDLPHAAPDLSAAISVQASRVAQFLYQKIPVGMTDQYSINPADRKLLVSDSERATFARYYEAATEPQSVMRALEAGRVTPEQAEALRVVWPNIYAECQQRITEAVVAHGKALPYDKTTQLGMLFDVPTHATLAPQVMQAVAAAHASKQQQDQGTPGPSTGKPIDIAHTFQTDFSAAQQPQE